MSKVIEGDFPFEELRDPDGDYFPNWQAARDAGYDDDQIWCITSWDGDDCDGYAYDSDGPHFVNFIGCIATAERHDRDTTYIETFEREEEDWDDDE